MNTIEIINKVSAPVENIEKIVNDSLAVFEKDNIYCEILFVDKTEIAALNKEHRTINKPTDVLSFPQISVPSAAISVLGSIVICPEVVAEKNELMPDVIKHGLLHLLGYDHEKNEREWDKAAAKIDCNL